MATHLVLSLCLYSGGYAGANRPMMLCFHREDTMSSVFQSKRFLGCLMVGASLLLPVSAKIDEAGYVKVSEYHSPEGTRRLQPILLLPMWSLCYESMKGGWEVDV